MRLTQWTDYALRVLMYCAACEGARSRDHHRGGRAARHLAQPPHEDRPGAGRAGPAGHDARAGWGLRLRVPAADIRLGDVVRLTESDFDMVECFDPTVNQCRLTGHCLLRGALAQATQSFLAVLDGVTLADLVARPAAAGATSPGRRRALAVVPVPGLPVRAPWPDSPDPRRRHAPAYPRVRSFQVCRCSPRILAHAGPRTSRRKDPT